MIKAPQLKSILEKYQTIYSIRSLLILSNWDIETYMPKAGITTRGIVTSKAETLVQQLSLDPEYVMDLKEVKAIENNPKLTDTEKSIIWHLWRSYENYTKLPPKFVEEYSKLTATSSLVWSEAKKEEDWKKFTPYLEKIFDMTKRYADYIGFVNHPYEALIEDYEPGLTINDYENYFKNLSSKLAKFNLSKTKGVSPLPREYSTSKLKELCSDILDLFGAKESVIRLDESDHPFTNSISTNDVRITTNYNKDTPLSAIYSTIHEFGHGLFGLQVAKEIELTPAYDHISYGVHESQSRFWENLVGRSHKFIEWLAPRMQNLGEGYEDLTENTLYASVNEVKPSLIRIEADELTYHYHILIRYEIEKALLEGSVNVKDAQELWNSKYQQYLGIKPERPSEGILQDIHWSLGLIGYFPSYSFGTVLSSIINEKIVEAVPNIDNDLINDDTIAKIILWLKENIHKYGGTYNYKEISSKFSGQGINLSPWFKYVSKKFKYLLK